MAISRFSATAQGTVYKFTSEDYERNGEKKTIHRVLIDQNDKVFTFNIKEELYNVVPRFTDVTLYLDYVEGGASGAYMSVVNIVPFSDASAGGGVKSDSKQETGKAVSK